MAGLVTFFQNLDRMGFTDIILPFILFFAVVYAILHAVKVFKQKNINVIVALCIALLVVIPHITGGYPPGGDVVDIVNSSIPAVVAILIAILMVMILLGMFGTKLNIEGKTLGAIIAILALLAVIIIFGSAAGWFGGSPSFRFPSWLGFLNDSDVVSVIVVLLVFGLIVAFITHEPKDPKEKTNPFKIISDALESSKEK